MIIQASDLSKEISYALRHAPWEYELELDEEGWVLVEQLLDSLKSIEKWKNISQEDIKQMIDNSTNKRHQMENGKIRALYGHSLHLKIKKEEKTPPSKLYHGTSYESLDNIKKEGLLPMSRQYVHLSVDIETALSVSKRKSKTPVVLEIDTDKARLGGVKFYLGNEKVWLTDFIPFNNIINLIQL